MKFLPFLLICGLFLAACQKESVPTAEITAMGGDLNGLAGSDDNIPDVLVELCNLDGSLFLAVDLYAKSDCSFLCKRIFEHNCAVTVPNINEQQKTVKIYNYLDYPNSQKELVINQDFYIWSPAWLGPKKNNKFETKKMEFETFWITVAYQW